MWNKNLCRDFFSIFDDLNVSCTFEADSSSSSERRQVPYDIRYAVYIPLCVKKATCSTIIDINGAMTTTMLALFPLSAKTMAEADR